MPDAKIFKDSTLNRMIINSRITLFPNDEREVLSLSYCKTLDTEVEKIDKKRNLQKYVMLGTKLSLHALAKSKYWYLDGTFKVVSSTYHEI